MAQILYYYIAYYYTTSLSFCLPGFMVVARSSSGKSYFSFVRFGEQVSDISYRAFSKLCNTTCYADFLRVTRFLKKLKPLHRYSTGNLERTTVGRLFST